MSKQDEREYPLPQGYAHLEEQGVKAIKYGHTLLLQGPGYTTKISDEIRKKINHNESVVICVTGPPGKGKTYFGIRYAQKLDPDFHINDTPPPPPDKDDGQTTFSREQLAYLTGENSPLVRGQVILTDESHFGIGARGWQNRDQQDIVNYLAAIRSKGFVLIIVVLHTEMIDKLLRNFVVNYEFYVTKRGEAIAYRRYFPQFSDKPHKKRLGKMKLQLPDEALCNWLDCLGHKRPCKYLHAPEEERCETIRAIYERRKEHFLNEKGREKQAEQETKTIKPSEIVEKLRDFRYDIPRRGTTVFRGRLAAFVHEKLGIKISRHTVTTVAWLVEETDWYREVINTIPIVNQYSV